MKKIFIGLIAFTLTLSLLACGKSIKAEYISVSDANVYLNVGGTKKVTYSVLPKDTTNKSVTFKSNDETIVTVDQEGNLKALKLGKTKVVITLEKQTDIKVEFNVSVVEKNWPAEKINNFAGFDLPTFPDFSNIADKVTEGKKIELTISGINDQDKAMRDYKDLLLADGWELDGSFDEHIAKFKKTGKDYSLVLHNTKSHNGTTIDLTLYKGKADEVEEEHEHEHGNIDSWEKLVAEVLKDLEVTIPNFENIAEFIFVSEVDGTFKVNVKTNPRRTSLEAYSNSHLGTYSKDGVKVFYHESHDDNDLINFTISKNDEEHEHEHQTIDSWEKLVVEVLKDLEVTIPNFENIDEFIFISEEDGTFKVNVKTNPRRTNLEAYIALLEASNSHLGTYSKDGVKVFYHESHDDNDLINFTISKDL